MSSEKIIRNCAPTLAGIKTANLFNEYFEDKNELARDISRFNKAFNKSGIRMILIALKDNRALIYVYRVKDLEHDLKDVLSKDMLSSYGYDTSDVIRAIRKLSSKIEEDSKFPHEIGLFLGYPPEDVKGFIDNDGKNYKSLGFWKVYGDEKKADETFKKYRLCQKILLNRFNMGYSLKQLVIEK